ncbi:MAG: carcinine hydrolase/isopenicillin-N N-acyltransferase family protein, partial [Pseudomonadota bacterium]
RDEKSGGAGRSTLQRWEDEASGKAFLTLVQKGSFADICFDHGELLATEIEEGVFPEILDTIAHDTDASADLKRGTLDVMLDALFSRITHDVHRAVSDEFRAGVEALEQGYFAGLADPMFGQREVVRACVAIDTGNIATGINRLLKKPGHSRVGDILTYASDALLRFRRGRAETNLHAALASDRESLRRELASGLTARARAGMGCTGFWATPADTVEGIGLHARTFDGAFFDWNEWPVFHLVDERETNGAWHRYAATGTAGLCYPGGISGMNEAGLSVSLHQMSTVNFSFGDRRGGFEIAPFVQQRILRECATLDEAVALCEGVKHFASWTILVSHAPTGKAVRIEINGRDDEDGNYDGRVVASAAEARMVQTNHFIEAGMGEAFDFFADAHFTPTVGKWMETRARVRTAETRLGVLTGTGLDTEGALGLLANHDDPDVGGGQRSFGRTICKSYGQMAAIMRADPARAAPKDALWMTIGDARPGNHSTLAGFEIDWAGLGLAPVGTLRAQTVSAAFREALAAFVEAFRQYERPRDGAARFYGRKPTATEMRAIRAEALEALDRAVAAAENAGEMDPGFRYLRARLSHEAGIAEAGPDRRQLLDAADADWRHLIGLIDGGAVPLDVWERARVLTLAAATAHARGQEAEGDALIARANPEIERAARELFGASKLHPGIKDWRRVAADIDANGAAADLPKIDWVTVE